MRKRAVCHPEREHYARGKCISCYRLPYTRRFQIKLRSKMILALGGKCNICGDNREPLLQMHHILGGGKGPPFIRYGEAKRNNWDRTKYQLLCANCHVMVRG